MKAQKFYHFTFPTYSYLLPDCKIFNNYYIDQSLWVFLWLALSVNPVRHVFLCSHNLCEGLALPSCLILGLQKSVSD